MFKLDKSWKIMALVFSIAITITIVSNYFDGKKGEKCYAFCEELGGTIENKEECYCFCMYDMPCDTDSSGRDEKPL